MEERGESIGVNGTDRPSQTYAVSLVSAEGGKRRTGHGNGEEGESPIPAHTGI